MRKIIIFGNSGSGKSTLAKELCHSNELAHLDLDTLAWELTSPPERKPLPASDKELTEFINSHDSWIIEGCYADLLNMAVAHSNEIIYMNLSIESCIANANSRPWEPHKYQSKQAQDANLGMLIDWIAQYNSRTDTFSESAHRELYDQYPGKKSMITHNDSNI